MSSPAKINDPMLALMMLPMLMWVGALKTSWRTKRNQDLEEMGLPTLDQKEEMGMR